VNTYADTGLLVSLYLPEATTMAAQAAVAKLKEPLPLIPLGLLELRNAFNFAIHRRRITVAEREALWHQVDQQIADGFFVLTAVATDDLHQEARRLSDAYTPTVATRSLDLLHVAAARLLGVKEMLTFDDRIRRASLGEGLKVRP